MYLKSIEIQGFKSFANKNRFDFHNGITGIVGPNGSGKSNVADAVRWVLGEQRVKQLRGGNMQDIIFAGTENRKPLSYAAVAITLSNSEHELPIDFEEVTVTRKLYRSGDSEYLINGSPCRLKDINELFYDTGIGKEGYSIIGQGQIDRILSGRPEERRELFDEAAGIVKHKKRKNMSLKKLADEEQNLVRVRDIMSELELQIPPLEKQSEKAKKYLEKKEQLKIYDINMFLLDMSRIQDKTKELELKTSYAQEELEKARHQFNERKQQYESVEEEEDAIEASIERYNTQLSESNFLKQQLENDISLLKEQINSVRRNDEFFRDRESAITDELSKREEQIRQTEETLSEIRKEYENTRAKEEKATTALFEVQSKIISLSADIEQEKNELLEILSNRAVTRAGIERYHAMLEQSDEQSSQTESDILAEEKIGNDLREQCEAEEKELTAIHEAISRLKEDQEKHQEKIEKAQRDIRGKNEIYQKDQTAFLTFRSRLETLKNIAEHYEGYGNSIKKVMDQKDVMKGIHGVVADLIQLEQKYETAVETALGGNIQNIIVDDEQTAKALIDHLKTNRYGRATFLPITAVHGKPMKDFPKLMEQPGVIAIADSLVKTEKKYGGIIKYLLGHTLVVDNVKNGIAISKKYKQGVRIVTLDGELFHPGGSMTGGRFKNSGSLLGRKRETEQLEADLEKKQKELEKLGKGIESLKETRDSLYKQNTVLSEEIQKELVRQNTLQLTLDQTKLKMKQSAERIRSLKNEQIEIELKIAEAKDNQEAIRDELEASEKLEAEIQARSGADQAGLETAQKEEAEMKKIVDELHLSTAAHEQKMDFLNENIIRMREEIHDFENEKIALLKSQGGSSKEIEEKEEKIRDIQKTIQDSEGLFEEIKQEIQKSKKQKEELSLKHKSFLQDREDLSKQILDLEKEMLRLEHQQSQYMESNDKLINYMWDEYELTYNQAAEKRDKNLTDLSDMKKNIARIKGEIKDLGNVNVNAIEEYKNLWERYSFLKEQHDDLVSAKEALEELILKLDTEMRRQFNESFKKISAEYDAVFKELFGGGTGTLEICEDQDLLEADIRVIAQPPGKKLQNMMQLSGGEKALTAIALLFAIQNLKPSPFCLLDEIEAALDDSNVIRFAKYLHKLTTHTQFIVITHRRGTMVSADRLYGITMQEKGVSTQVSVSLLDKDSGK